MNINVNYSNNDNVVNIGFLKLQIDVFDMRHFFYTFTIRNLSLIVNNNLAKKLLYINKTKIKLWKSSIFMEITCSNYKINKKILKNDAVQGVTNRIKIGIDKFG